MLTGSIVGFNPDGTVQVACDQTNQTYRCDPPSFGGNFANVQFGLSLQDIVLIDDYHEMSLLTIVAKVATPYKGRYGDQRGTKTLLLEGETVLIGKGGQQVYLDSVGNIRLMPGPSGKIYLGQDVLGKAVARDGDSVSLSTGGTGTIHASTGQVYSD